MAKISDMAEATVPAATMEVEVNDSGASKRISLGTLNTIPWGGYMTLTGTTGITASTTQTQGQMPLTSTFNVIATVANANDTVTLPTAATGRVVYVLNVGANTAKIFPASGDSIASGAVNASVTILTMTVVGFIAANDTNWVAWS